MNVDDGSIFPELPALVQLRMCEVRLAPGLLRGVAVACAQLRSLELSFSTYEGGFDQLFEDVGVVTQVRDRLSRTVLPPVCLMFSVISSVA